VLRQSVELTIKPAGQVRYSAAAVARPKSVNLAGSGVRLSLGLVSIFSVTQTPAHATAS
jgi:hypothetical protein